MYLIDFKIGILTVILKRKKASNKVQRGRKEGNKRGREEKVEIPKIQENVTDLFQR